MSIIEDGVEDEASLEYKDIARGFRGYAMVIRKLGMGQRDYRQLSIFGLSSLLKQTWKTLCRAGWQSVDSLVPRQKLRGISYLHPQVSLLLRRQTFRTVTATPSILVNCCTAMNIGGFGPLSPLLSLRIDQKATSRFSQPTCPSTSPRLPSLPIWLDGSKWFLNLGGIW
ncbi:hypothetical protein JAAARDRAFT_501312 [Jaapia argillacea MUCL 33604]|uniref:Uncharacterized protein n=1 Tax=Jaapia argillacea MUCL 33604 TaxID=933084 RepID=A0A067PKU3_9AGAM|nr:hypothetical protein JAAARDRAFT_501312 [Jaapia argillacea MUCL 33604]